MLNNKQAFTLIEIILAMTLVAILAALSISYIWGSSQKEARDSIRMSHVSQIGTIAAALQTRFSFPPLSKTANDHTKYPSDCLQWADFYKCLTILKVASDDKLREMLQDPRPNTQQDWQNMAYYYWAQENWFQICTILENQWAFDKLNADKNWKLFTNGASASSSSAESANMYCLVEWTIDQATVEINEIKVP